MGQLPLLERVARLELRVTSLERLPEDIAELGQRTTAGGSQILELRQEVRIEFSAMNARIDAQAKRTDEEFAVARVRIEELGQRMDASFAAVYARIDESWRLTQASIDEKWRHTLVLHEDLVDRIKTIGEQLAPAGGRAPSRKTVRRKPR
jgi:hypothetical protein